MKKFLSFFLLFTAVSCISCFAQDTGTTGSSVLSISSMSPLNAIHLILVVALITLAPSVLLLTTSFIRVAVILDFIKRSLSLQAVPPNQIVMGIALFLTLFIMWPVFENIYNDAYKPYSKGEITGEEAYANAEAPLRVFMYNQMKGHPENIRLFMSFRGLPKPTNLSQVPTYVLIPAFVLNELTVAFKIGILIFIPFVVIDMVVASILMSMGMVMVSPALISLPFKLILFVLVDGWNLIIGQIINSFVV